jgi:hypothetical protein
VNGIQKSLARATTLVTMLGVLALGAAPAMAASPINYFRGTANGQAMDLKVSPNALVNADLTYLNTVIDALPAGLATTLHQQLDGTLQNATGDVRVQLNTAKAEGESLKGTDLTSGQGVTAPASVDSAALKVQLDLLKKALKNIPVGAAKAITTALQPILANGILTASQVTLITNDLNTLTAAIADTLGSPSVNALDPVTATLKSPPGEDKPFNVINIQSGGVLTSAGPFKYGDVHAKAMADEALGLNTVQNANLVPTGLISVPNIKTLVEKLQNDINAVFAVAQSVTTTLGLGQVNTVLGTVQTVTGGVTTTLGSTVQTALDTVITQTKNISILADLINALSLDGNVANSLLGTGVSNSVGQISRQGDVAQANSKGSLADLQVVNLRNPALRTVLNRVPGLGALTNVDSLASVSVLKSTALVTLNGNDPAHQQAESSVAGVKVLGIDLAAKAGAPLDQVLVPGRVCHISVPGGTEGCGPLSSLIPNNINTPLDGLLNITLARGVAQYDRSAAAMNANATQGAASIVGLEVTVSVNCNVVPALQSLNPTLKSLIGVTLCGGTAPQAPQAGARTSRAVTTGGMQLVDVKLGVADAALTLKPGDTPTTSNPPQLPPNTGNTLWILAVFAAALVLAGAGIQVFRTRTAEV